jgi:hypothetical protein
MADRMGWGGGDVEAMEEKKGRERRGAMHLNLTPCQQTVFLRMFLKGCAEP